MPKNGLPTKKQREVYEFIEKFIAEHDYAPSFREIQTGMDLKSVSTVASHVNSLIARGLIKKGDGYSARSLILVSGQEKPETKDDISLIKQKISQLSQNEADNKADIEILNSALEILQRH